MPKSPFANSKAALVFAAMTIISTLMIVGSRDGGAMLDVTASRLAEKTEIVAEEALPVSEPAAEEIEPLDPASGWGGTGDEVFGDYYSEDVMPSASDAGSDPALNGQSASDAFGVQGPVSDEGFADIAG